MKFKARQKLNAPVIEIPGEEVRELIKVGDKWKLQDIFDQARKMQTLCQDFNVKDGSINYRESKLNYFCAKEWRRKSITQYALGQLCTRIGVPFSYIKKCMKEKQDDLVQQNINTWLDRSSKDYLIREYDNTVRGVLSSRYSKFDTPEILNVIQSNADIDNFIVKGHFISPERFHLRLVEDRKLFKSDDLSAGIQIDSSDVGRALLRVQFLIFKQVCTNGLIAPVDGSIFFEQKHIGIDERDFKKRLVAGLKEFGNVRRKVIDLVADSKKRDIPFENQPKENTVQFISDKAQLSEAQAQEVYDVMLQKNYEPTRWGLANTLTDYAQRFTLERRLEIEKNAGLLLVA